MFPEKDGEVADWREQIFGVASNTSIQPNNSTLSDVSRYSQVNLATV